MLGSFVQLLAVSMMCGLGFTMWSTILHRLVFKDNGFLAKAMSSFSYNVWAVLYSGFLASSLFRREEFPWLFYSPSDAELAERIEVLIFVSVGYFISDMYLDPDPAFVVHHLVSTSAFLLSWYEPTVQTVLTLNVLFAEMGGVFYN